MRDLNRTLTSLLTLLSAFLLPFLATAGNVVAGKTPEIPPGARLETIQKIVSDYQKAGERLSDPDVQKSIMSDISKLMPLSPKEKADTRDTKQIAEEARAIVAKKFTLTSSDIIKGAESAATAKFAMSAVLDYVYVRYQKGELSFSAEGVFYGYGGNSIKVGDKVVALYDLVPEHRVKFDKDFNEQKKKEFIDGQVREYFDKKNQYNLEVFTKIREEQAKSNEAKGYISAWKDWRTAKEVAEVLITTAASKASASASTATADEGKEQASAKDDKAASAAKQAEQPAVATNPAQAADETYDSLKRKVDKRLMEIANTCSGIDADQGYKLALWGLTRAEVSVILSKEGVPLTYDKGRDIDTFKPADGPIKDVELSYMNGILVKATIWFRLTDSDGIVLLRKALSEKYGLTDEEKKEMNEAEEEKKVDKAEKPEEKKDDKKPEEKKDDKKKDDKKKDEKKAPQIPSELSYHWTGKTTTGTIYFKANAARTAFEEIKLVKTSPDLIKRIAAQLDEDRRVKEEEKRQKSAGDGKKKLEF